MPDAAVENSELSLSFACCARFSLFLVPRRTLAANTPFDKRAKATDHFFRRSARLARRGGPAGLGRLEGPGGLGPSDDGHALRRR